MFIHDWFTNWFFSFDLYCKFIKYQSESLVVRLNLYLFHIRFIFPWFFLFFLCFCILYFVVSDSCFRVCPLYKYILSINFRFMSDVCRELGLGYQVNGLGHTEWMAELLASVYMSLNIFLKNCNPEVILTLRKNWILFKLNVILYCWRIVKNIVSCLKYILLC